MKLYLSSYRIGNDKQLLLNLTAKGSKVAIIANAFDGREPSVREKVFLRVKISLEELGYNVSEIDLREFFVVTGLKEKLSMFDMVWVTGGNVFSLALAMKISGFKEAIGKLLESDSIVYAGYSAGACIAGNTLEGLELVDPISEIPKYYPDTKPTYDGLGFLNFVFVPHFKSEHPESAAIDGVVSYLESKAIKYRD